MEWRMLAVVIFGEVLNTLQVTGLCLIVIGVGLAAVKT